MMKTLIIIASFFVSLCANAQKESKKILSFKNTKPLLVGVKGKSTKPTLATSAKAPAKATKAVMPKNTKATIKENKATDNTKLKKDGKTLANATKAKTNVAKKETVAKATTKGKDTKTVAKNTKTETKNATKNIKTKAINNTIIEKNVAVKKGETKECKKTAAKKIVATKAPVVAKKPLAVKVKKVIPTLEHPKEVVHQEQEAKFEMLYPTGFFSSEIKDHFGKMKIGDVWYNNESVKLVTQLEREVECNVDTAVVTDVAVDDDGLYIVSLKRKHYTIVMGNLSYVEVAAGDSLIQGDFIGLVNQDSDLDNRGSMELMLLKDTKILNPEKYMVRQLSPKPVVTPVVTEAVAPTFR